jgi:hypothetical protein
MGGIGIVYMELGNYYFIVHIHPQLVNFISLKTWRKELNLFTPLIFLFTDMHTYNNDTFSLFYWRHISKFTSYTRILHMSWKGRDQGQINDGLLQDLQPRR